jgi:two-component system response regulator FixJ
MPIVIMTGHGDISIAIRAMKAGAVDFLEKPFEKAALINAIEESFQRIADAASASARAAEAEVILAALTARERDVLEGLAKGLPNKTIAYDLGISPRTVEVHRANLMTKLEVRSLSDALRIAFAAGLGI